MPDSETRARRLSSNLMSPFCPGKTLDACPSPRAGQWRAEIRVWAAEGVEDREIVERLSARVPDFDLSGRPGAAWDWALPISAMAVASGVLWVVVRRMRRAAAAASEPSGAPPAPEESARLERELEAFERG